MLYRLNLDDLKLTNDSLYISIISQQALASLCLAMRKNPAFVDHGTHNAESVNEAAMLTIKGFVLPENHSFYFKVKDDDARIVIERLNLACHDFLFLPIRHIYENKQNPTNLWLLRVIATVSRATKISTLESFYNGFWQDNISYHYGDFQADEYDQEDRENILLSMSFYKSKAFKDIVYYMQSLSYPDNKIPKPVQNHHLLTEIYDQSVAIIKSKQTIRDYYDRNMDQHRDEYSLTLEHATSIIWQHDTLFDNVLENMYQMTIEDGDTEQPITTSSYTRKEKFVLPKENNIANNIESWMTTIMEFTKTEM